MSWQTFLKDALPQLGAEADWTDGRLELLAPPPLGNGDVQTFWTGEPQDCPSDLTPLYPGHPLLEATQRALEGRGQLVARHRPPSAQRKGELPALARKAFTCRNAHLEVATPVPVVQPWLFFHFRVSYQWDERRVELRTVGIDSLHGTLLEPACLEKVWLEPGALSQGDRSRLSQAYQRARLYLDSAIQPRRQALEREARRYQEAERGRLERYYGTLLQDLSRRQGGAEKRERVQQERELRRRDLEEKLRLKVSAELVQVELVDLPREQISASLKQRQRSRELLLTYNPVRHDFDPLACEGCQGATKNLWLCDQGHLLCPQCQGVCRDCRKVQCACCLGTAVSPVCGGCTEAAEAAKKAAPPPPKNVSKVVPRQVKSTRPKSAPQPLFARIFEDLLYFEGLAQRLQPVDQALQRNDFPGCERLLRQMAFELVPGPVRTRVRDCLEALKERRGDKIRQRLEEMADSPQALCSDSSSEYDLSWLRAQLKGVFSPRDIEKVVFHVNLQLPLVAPRSAWPWEVVAVCLVYMMSSLSQRDTSHIFDIPIPQISRCSREIDSHLRAVADRGRP